MKKVEEKDKGRKPRSDRKRHVQPTISVDLYDCLDRIAYITSTPLKDVGERLCLEGLRSKKVIDELSPFFRRDYSFINEFGDPFVITGSSHRMPFKVNRGEGDRGRLSIRFDQGSHDLISALAYSLDLTIASAVAFLLEVSFEMEIGVAYITRYMEYECLNNERREYFYAILDYLNEDALPSEKVTKTELLMRLSVLAYEKNQLIRPFLEDWIRQYTNYPG